MDQAVSLLAEAGKALIIDFFPLSARPTPLPEDVVFVVCNSLIRAPKSESVRYAYNRRVIECRLATALLTKAVEAKTGRNVPALRLADLSAERLGVDPAVLNDWAQESIQDRPRSLVDIAHQLGTTPQFVEKEICILGDGSTLREPPDGFRVWNRYRHVVSEAARVRLMARALEERNPAEIGSLMNQSHASCRDDYEISCPELDALVSIARKQGALGARLTGAGFGGCTVNAVPTETVEQFVKGVTAEYYDGYVKRGNASMFSVYRNLRDVVFPCRASKGAGCWPASELMG
jgi:N-acetylgalactosamine kinase